MCWKFGSVVAMVVSLHHARPSYYYRGIESIDIGGGSVPDTEIHSLAHITLRWMVKEVVQSKCGILFDELALERGEVHISLLGESSANEPALVDCDAVDASKPLDDELRLSLKSNMFWWIPEMLPLSYFYQDENRVWQRGHRSVRFFSDIEN